ncbi:InlB B-repeat-containing protein [Methanorbis furvi]
MLIAGALLAGPAAADTYVTNFSELKSAITANKDPVIVICENISLTAVLTINSDVTITTDGTDRSLIRYSAYKNSIFKISSGGNLTLTGNDSGILTLDGYNLAVSTNGAGVYVDGGNFTMRNCTITGNKANASGTSKTTYSGGGVYVASGNFTMSGGTITGNTATANGGGVYVASGNFTMSGGTITGNTATANGGGVYVASGNFTMSGGTITDNTAKDSGGVYVQNGGILTMNDSIISDNYGSNAIYFTGTHIIVNNCTISDNNAAGLSCSGNTIVNNCTISGNSGLGLSCGSNAIVNNCTISGNSGTGLSCGSNVIVNNCTISGNSGTSGGGVKGANVTMNSCTISDNTATDGGGVFVNGVFVMNDSTISNNTAIGGSGGGVYIYSSTSTMGTFTMNSGSISDNNAMIASSFYGGGGVYVNGVFVMNGGTITNNTATYGGGVILGVGYNKIFDMKGGTITGNTATGKGGGVYTYGCFTMFGGTITGNTATDKGGGVYLDSNSFSMCDTATISGNIATNGGGIYVVDGTTFNMNGGEISDNSATMNGSEVYLSSSSNPKFWISSASNIGPNTTYIAANTFIKVGFLPSDNKPVVQNITPQNQTEGAKIVQLFTGATAESEDYFTLSPDLKGIALKYSDVSSPPELRIVIINSDYSLTVINGSGTGSYPSGRSVSISATPQSGKEFVNWTSSMGGTFGNNESETTTFIMPDNDATVTATFKDISPTDYSLTVINGSGTGSYPSGRSVSISATPQPDKEFVNWTSSMGGTFGNNESETTTFIMPDNDVTVTANFKNILPTPVPTFRPSVDSSDSKYSDTIIAYIDDTGAASFDNLLGFIRIILPKGTYGTVILNTAPSGVTAPLDSYTVCNITVPEFQGFAQIEFSVPIALLRDQGLTVNDVVLRHYTNGQWVNLPTFYLGEERGAATYVASTSSFSPFAIVYERGGATIVEKSTPQPTASSGTAKTAAATAVPTVADDQTQSANSDSQTISSNSGATAAPTLTQAPASLAGLFAGLLAACLLVRRRV